jgi:hypothetical protein
MKQRANHARGGEQNSIQLRNIYLTGPYETKDPQVCN